MAKRNSKRNSSKNAAQVEVVASEQQQEESAAVLVAEQQQESAAVVAAREAEKAARAVVFEAGELSLSEGVRQIEGRKDCAGSDGNWRKGMMMGRVVHWQRWQADFVARLEEASALGLLREDAKAAYENGALGDVCSAWWARRVASAEHVSERELINWLCVAGQGKLVVLRAGVK